MLTIMIEGKRNGYTPEQCGATMTVGELCDALQAYAHEDTPVYLCNDNGYTYGSINWNSIDTADICFESEEEDDE